MDIKGILEGVKNVASIVKAAQNSQEVTPKERAFCKYAIALAILAAVALLGCWLWPWDGSSATDKRIDALKEQAADLERRAEVITTTGKRKEGEVVHAAVNKARSADADRLPVLLAGLLSDWRREQAQIR